MKFVDDAIAKVEDVTGIRLPSAVRHPFNVIWTLFHDLNRCDLMKQASAMAYVTLLSLIPSLVAIFCVISLFSPMAGKGSNLIDQLKSFILSNLASGSGESVVTYLDKMLSNLDVASMGITSFGSVLVTLILLLRQIEEALNRIWFIKKGRNIFARFMYFWTFMTLGVLVLGLGFGLSSGFSLEKYLSPATAAQNGVPGWIVGIIGSFLFFFFVYKVVPNCRVAARHAAVGAIVSAVLLQQSSRFYGLYVKHAVSIQTLYGVLAQLPLFLTWLYICWIIILLGALISWRMQEGFPDALAENTFDAATNPVEHLRNVKVQAMLPLITLVAIYKSFHQGSGRGVSEHDLTHALKLPSIWISEALDVLSSLGYVIASKPAADEGEGASALDPYFPAYPAESLTLSKMQADLARPVDEWLRDWKHDLPLDLAKTIAVFGSANVDAHPDSTFADALAL